MYRNAEDRVKGLGLKVLEELAQKYNLQYSEEERSKSLNLDFKNDDILISSNKDSSRNIIFSNEDVKISLIKNYHHLSSEPIDPTSEVHFKYLAKQTDFKTNLGIPLEFSEIDLGFNIVETMLSYFPSCVDKTKKIFNASKLEDEVIRNLGIAGFLPNREQRYENNIVPFRK